jgi:hypothetical protein
MIRTEKNFQLSGKSYVSLFEGETEIARICEKRGGCLITSMSVPLSNLGMAELERLKMSIKNQKWKSFFESAGSQ